MNSDEFLKELQYKLRGLPEDERINAVRFFDEYIHKANLSPGTDVTTLCGTPEEAARQVMEGSIDNKSVKKSVRAHETRDQREGRHNGILGIIVLLGLLLTGGIIALAVLGIAFDLKNFRFITSSDRVISSVALEDDFTSIDVDADTARIMVIADGDDYKLDYSLPSDRITYEVNDRKLTVRYDSPNVIGFSNGSNSYINVHVPKDSELADIVLNADTGSVDLQNVSCTSAKLETDTGHTGIKGTTATELSLTSNTGAISVESTKVEGTFSADADTGSITINDSEVGDAIIETDTGSLHMSSTSFNSISAELDTGGIHIEAPGKPEDYSMDLETDTGSVYVDGNKEGKSYSSTSSTGKTIKAETDTGSVKISFQ